MTISERLKQVGQRFGNPSGTAQNANFAGLGLGCSGTMTTLATAVGSARLASPFPAAASKCRQVVQGPTLHYLRGHRPIR